MVSAVVLIKAQIGAITEVARSLVLLKGITHVYSVAGNYDLVALVAVKENDDLADLVTHSIRKIPDISATETLIAFRVYTHEEMAAAMSFGIEG